MCALSLTCRRTRSWLSRAVQDADWSFAQGTTRRLGRLTTRSWWWRIKSSNTLADPRFQVHCGADWVRQNGHQVTVSLLNGITTTVNQQVSTIMLPLSFSVMAYSSWAIPCLQQNTSCLSPSRCNANISVFQNFFNYFSPTHINVPKLVAIVKSVIWMSKICPHWGIPPGQDVQCQQASSVFHNLSTPDVQIQKWTATFWVTECMNKHINMPNCISLSVTEAEKAYLINDNCRVVQNLPVYLSTWLSNVASLRYIIHTKH